MNQQPPQSESFDQFLRGLAIGLWLALAVVIAVKTVQNPENHSTYPIYRVAARAWWDGVNVYSFSDFNYDYRYGPSFALVFYPLAWMPARAGAVIWAMLNVGVAYWATVALCRRLLPGTASPRMQNLVLIAAMLPAAHCLYTGQTNLLVFALAAFAAIALLDRRWWLAALLLAASVHIKVWPLAGAVLLTACWPRRLWWRLPLALLMVAALPLLVKPPAVVLDQYVQWYQHLVGPAQLRHSYRDAWTIWELIAAPAPVINPPRLYTFLQVAAGTIALGLCLWQSFRLPPRRLALLALVSWTTWQLVFGPATERNTFALIAPLTGWAVVVAVAQRRAAWLMILSYLLTVLSAIRGVEGLSPWLKTLHPVGILLFFAWFLWWNATERSETESATQKSGGDRGLARFPPSRLSSPHSKDSPPCLVGEI
jgi:hypothetical protein